VERGADVVDEPADRNGQRGRHKFSYASGG
jgi:hypothetical protein